MTGRGIEADETSEGNAPDVTRHDGSASSRPRRVSTVWAWLLLAVFLAATFAVFFVRRTNLEGAPEKRFDDAVAEVSGPEFEKSLAPYAEFVEEMARRTEAGGFTHEEFVKFIDGELVATRLPATYVAVVTERVPHEDLDDFAARLRSFGPIESWGIRQPEVLDPNAEQHDLILYSAPEGARGNAVGLDIGILLADDALVDVGTDATMFGAVEYALIEAFGDGELPDSTDTKQWLGIVGTTINNPDGTLGGVAAVVVYLDSLVSPIVDAHPGVGLEIVGETIPILDFVEAEDTVLVTEPDVPASEIVKSGFSSVETVDVLGTPWTFTFRELDGFTNDQTGEQWLWLGAGLLVSFLLFGLVYSQLRARDRALDMVDEATVEIRATADELRESEERFRRAFEDEKRLAQRLREADELKAEFMSMASHELRTPLTAAAAFVDTVILQWDRLDEEKRKELLGRASGNAKELTRLIDQLLASVRLEDDAMDVEPETCNLSSLIDDVTGPIAPLLADHELVVDVDPSLQVRAAPEAFSHVLSNLLTNATKYSDAGTTIRVSARRSSGTVRGDMVEIAVSDKGSGIPPADLDRVFERFFQSAEGRRSSRRGMGVGLAIARRYVEAQGGEIRVESTVGEGSTFTFTLPAAGSSEPTGVPGHQDAPART